MSENGAGRPGFHERLRPPAGEVSVPDAAPCVYEIDWEDRIVALSDEWYRFARDNDAGRSLIELLPGVSLWELITGAEVRYLYESIFAGVRRRQRPVRLPFRCDSPNLRRYMELEISPAEGGGLRLSGHLLHEESREEIGVLAPRSAPETSSPRPETFVAMCSWCKAARLRGEWGAVEELVRAEGLFQEESLPRISHSICPDCRDSVRGALRGPPS